MGESGERKTTVDGHFTKAIQEYQELKNAEAKAKLPEYEAKRTVWEKGLAKIHADLDKALRTEKADLLPELEAKLSDYLKLKPEKPKLVRLIYQNATPEALIHGLSQSPSAVIMSDEGGGIVNGRTMGDLGIFNDGWGGWIQAVDRKTSENIDRKSVRLTVSLMLQKAAFMKFLKRKGDEARGIGFFARCLICYPESTQGHRFIREEYQSREAVNKFNARITEILNTYPVDADCLTNRITLELSPEAKVVWINAYNEIEGMMQAGYWLCDVRDFASKFSENMARLAALFHFFEGAEGNITEGEMLSAREIMRWFVTEFKRLFGSAPPVPQDYSDAMLLEAWLDYERRIRGKNIFPKNYIRQYVPNKLRDIHRLNAALNYLMSTNRITMFRENKKVCVALNFIPGDTLFAYEKLNSTNHCLINKSI
jgi:hypothetical protein